MANNRKSNFIVRGGFDGSGISKGLSRTQKQFAQFQVGLKNTMKLVGATFGALAIGSLVKESVNAASELEGAFVGLQSILAGQGKNFEQAKDYINDYIKDGLVPLGNAVTAYKNLAQRGYNDEQIQQVMTRLKDAASFGRQASYTLGEAVSTATEGLKNENSILVDNAGVTKNVSKMWQDYAKSIGKATTQLTQEEKIQAEVNGIINETRFQVGDAAKYADTYAGRVAALSKTLRDVKVNLGNAFIPIANTILPLLQTLGNALAKVTSTFSQFSQALFGKAIKPKATQQQAIAIENLGDATKEAGKQAKGALTGFDEINNLNLGTDTQSVLPETGNVTMSMIEVDDGTGGAMEEITSKAQAMADKMKTVFNEFKDTVVRNKDIILPALGAIAGSLAALAAFQGLQNLQTSIRGIGVAASGAWKAISAHPLVAVLAVVAAVIGALITAYKTNDKFKSSIDNLWASLMSKLEPALARLGQAISVVWVNVFVPFGDFLDRLWKSVLLPVATVITDVLGAAFAILGEIALMVWDNVLKPIADFLVTVWVAAINGVVEIMDHWKNNILKPIAAYLEHIFAPVINGLAKLFKYLWIDVLKPLASYMWGTFKPVLEDSFAAIKGAINGLKRVFTGLITFITGIFTANWKKAWEGVRNIFGGIADTLYALFKTPINLIIKAVNWMIDGLNKIKIDVPDWMSKITGIQGSFGFNIGKIPELAKGGLVNRPTLAMVGERGPEAVVPLENTGFVDAIASAVGTAVMAAMSVTNQGDNDKEVIMEVEGVKFGRVLLPILDDEARRLGYRPILQT